MGKTTPKVPFFKDSGRCLKIVDYNLSELCQTSKMKHFAKICNGRNALTIFAKNSILDIWQGSEYTYLTYLTAGMMLYFDWPKLVCWVINDFNLMFKRNL